jgi:hypothetical protein
VARVIRKRMGMGKAVEENNIEEDGISSNSSNDGNSSSKLLSSWLIMAAWAVLSY